MYINKFKKVVIKIGSSILVDKKGKIVAKNLRGLDLELRIKKLIDG